MANSIADLKVDVNTKDILDAADATKKMGDSTVNAAKQMQDLIAALGKTTSAIADLEKNSNKVAGALKDVATSFNPVKAGIGVLTGIISGFSAGALKGMITGVIEGAAELNNLSTQTGLTVEQLSIMKSVAAQGGTSMDTVTGAIIKFQKAIAASGNTTSLQSKAFKELGINTSDTSKSTAEYMEIAAQKLDGLADGWQKNNIVMALFGKTGTEVNEFLSDYANRGEMAAKITAEQAQASEDYERTMKKLGASTNQWKTLIAMDLLPVMNSLGSELLKSITNVNKLDDGQKELIKSNVAEWAFGFAKALGATIDVARALWNIISGLATAIGVTAGEFVNVIESFGKAMKGDFSGAMDHLNAGFDALKDGMKDAWTTASKDSSTFYDLVIRAESNYRSSLGKTAAAVKDSKRTPGNIGDGNEKPVKEPPIIRAIKEEEAALINLQGEYAKLTGQREKTATQLAQLNLANAYFTKGMTDSQKATYLQKAADIDAAKARNDRTKADMEAWKQVEDLQRAQSAQTQALRQSNSDQAIANKVLHTFGATLDDVNIALNKRAIAETATKLAIAQASGATDQETQVLKDQLQALKERGELLADRKDEANDELAYQRRFDTGWSKAFNEYKKNATDASQAAGSLFSNLTQSMEDGLVNFATTGKLNFKDFASSVITDLARIAAKKAIVGLFDSVGGGSGIVSSAASFFGFANGGAFSKGVQMYASGDVFNQPTAFNAGGKLGIMGEAGPEAIMPLTRGSDGKLGVKTSGGSSGGANLTINTPIVVNFQGDAGSAEDRAALMKGMVEQTQAVVRKEMRDQMRAGGMLNPVRR